jgi:hypothetical protein
MKRILVILGVTAAMAVAPSVSSAGTSSLKLSPQNVRSPVPVAGFILQIKTDSRSGHTLYRTGNTGLWME